MLRIIIGILIPPLGVVFILYAILTGGSGVKQGLQENGRKLDLQTLAILDPNAARAKINQEQDDALVGAIVVAAVAVVGAVWFVLAKTFGN